MRSDKSAGQLEHSGRRAVDGHEEDGSTQEKSA